MIFCSCMLWFLSLSYTHKIDFGFVYHEAYIKLLTICLFVVLCWAWCLWMSQPFLPISVLAFSLCLVCGSSSASFWISLRGNCPMCKLHIWWVHGRSVLGWLPPMSLCWSTSPYHEWELFLQGVVTDSSSVSFELNPHFKNCDDCWFKNYCNLNCEKALLLCWKFPLSHAYILIYYVV